MPLPMAIVAGRRLADRLFGGTVCARSKVDYKNVPTVVCSHPPIETNELTEQEALSKYGQSNINIYKSTFANLLYYGLFETTGQSPK